VFVSKSDEYLQPTSSIQDASSEHIKINLVKEATTELNTIIQKTFLVTKDSRQINLVKNLLSFLIISQISQIMRGSRTHWIKCFIFPLTSNNMAVNKF